MTRETIMALAIIIGGIAWLIHAEPAARVAATVLQAQEEAW